MNRLKKYRLKHGLSQAEIAKWLKVDQASVSNWERGMSPSGPASILINVLTHDMDCHPKDITVRYAKKSR